MRVLSAPIASASAACVRTAEWSRAIGFHFVDYVVHGWDVARSIDAPFELPTEVMQAVLPLVLAVPDGEVRKSPGAPFAPAITSADAASDLDRVLLHLGRSPEWAAAQRS